MLSLPSALGAGCIVLVGAGQWGQPQPAVSGQGGSSGIAWLGGRPGGGPGGVRKRGSPGLERALAAARSSERDSLRSKMKAWKCSATAFAAAASAGAIWGSGRGGGRESLGVGLALGLLEVLPIFGGGPVPSRCRRRGGDALDLGSLGPVAGTLGASGRTGALIHGLSARAGLSGLVNAGGSDSGKSQSPRKFSSSIVRCQRRPWDHERLPQRQSSPSSGARCQSLAWDKTFGPRPGCVEGIRADKHGAPGGSRRQRQERMPSSASGGPGRRR